MMRSLSFRLTLILTLSCFLVFAKDEQPARSQSALFMTSAEFVVTRWNVSKIDIGAISEWLLKVNEGPKNGMGQKDPPIEWRHKISAFSDILQGIKDRHGDYAYTFSGIPNIADSGTYFLISAANQDDLDSLRIWANKVAGQPKPAIVAGAPASAVVRDGAVFFGSELQMKTVLSCRRNQWPYLEAALKTAGDDPVVLIYTSDGAPWNLIADEEERSVIHGVDWAAIGMTCPPEPRLRVKIECTNALAASELMTFVRKHGVDICLRAGLTKMAAEDFLKLATPTIAGNMITLELGENTLQQLVRDIAIQPR